MRCLEKEPGRRYQDGRALLRALETCEDDPSWSSALLDPWWQAWLAAPAARVEESPSLAVTRRNLGPLFTEPFALTRREDPVSLRSTESSRTARRG